MKQARSPSARTEEWTFQRRGKHTPQGTAIIPPGERQPHFPGNDKCTSLGTTNVLPWERQMHFLGNDKHTS